MGDVLNFPEGSRRLLEKTPHRLQLNHCRWCDLEIRAQWNLAAYSAYDLDAEEEHSPRIDSVFDRDED